MKKTMFAIAALAVLAAHADLMERPMGIRIGRHLTIRPYVSLYYTWDSNIDSRPNGTKASVFNINPGLTFAYRQDNWSIQGGAYYQYHAYTENPGNLDTGSWGENVAFNWTNSRKGGRGWSLVLRENLQQISQDDDMTNDGGRGVGRDRLQLEFAGTLQRRFTDRFHGDIDASYYFLDYKNDTSKYAPLYGWQRWTAGAQMGYVLSKWTDLLLMGTYQGYKQDNATDLSSDSSWSKVGNNSQGYTVHVGVGSYATEKISYRLSGGYMYFNYGDGASTDGGFSYAASGQWRMNDTWNMMLLASSYYQPDTMSYGSYARVDSVSWGIAHSMIRNKLTATLDLAYRHEDRSAAAAAGTSTYNDDIITGRLALTYAINRFVSVFGHAEYQTAFYRSEYLESSNAEWDYDRWRLSVGLRLTY